MSRFSDDSLGAVINHQTEGSGARATTPQMKRTQRKRTPQRTGSAPRSSSANKVSALAKACFESQSCNRSLSRNAGRKKQQKWENDNLFGLSTFMKKVDALNKKHYDSDDEWSGTVGIDGQPLTNQGLNLNWQSLFGTLTNGDNDDALETYLKCSNSYQTNQKRGGSRCIRDCHSEWERAEFAWLKVEKRLRTILLQALGEKQGGGKEARAFVTAVEELLLLMETEQGTSQAEEKARDKGLLPVAESVAHLFPTPPRLVQPSCSTLSREDEQHDTSSSSDAGLVILRLAQPHLVVTLLDSPFHRLLLHATCQFHHMHSKSFTDKSQRQLKGARTSKGKGKGKQEGSSGVRATRISPFQSTQASHSISLVPFVLLKLSTLEDKSSSQKKHQKKNMSPSLSDKENVPRNSVRAGQQDEATDTVVKQDDDDDEEEEEKEKDCGMSLSDLVLENRQDSARLSGDKGDEDEEADDDEEEYCLVNLVSPSGGNHSNPIESREEC